MLEYRSTAQNEVAVRGVVRITGLIKVQDVQGKKRKRRLMSLRSEGLKKETHIRPRCLSRCENAACQQLISTSAALQAAELRRRAHRKMRSVNILTHDRAPFRRAMSRRCIGHLLFLKVGPEFRI